MHTRPSYRMSLTLLLLTLMMSMACAENRLVNYTLEVVKTYPHDTTAYTQGLFFHDGKLCESTGLYGESTYRQNIDFDSGKAEKKLDFDKRYFVEGSVVVDDELYILTWYENIAFVYDAQTLAFKRGHRYPRQGWGLTTDGKQLIASDGTSRLYFMDKTFKVHRTIDVKMDGKPLGLLNELEWIDGMIWANVYTHDFIAIIHPKSGKVVGKIDAKALLPENLRTVRTDVLNGIAYDGKRIFVTGKNWPLLFEVKAVAIKSRKRS